MSYVRIYYIVSLLRNAGLVTGCTYNFSMQCSLEEDSTFFSTTANGPIYLATKIKTRTILLTSKC